VKTRIFQNERSFLWDLFWDEGWFLVIVIWIFCWWFLIPYFLFKWIYKYIYVPVDDRKEIENSRQAAADEKVQVNNQLELLALQLREAAPKTPVDRMRATILLNNPALPGGASRYSVDMMVELSEEERAIVYQHDIEFIEIENVARYSPDELARMRYEHQQEVDAISGVRQPTLKAITKVVMDDVNESQKKDRLRTSVGDLLVVPYRRLFDTAHEAKEHSDKLKTDLLPKIRKIIDGYRTYKAAETVEF